MIDNDDDDDDDNRWLFGDVINNYDCDNDVLLWRLMIFLYFDFDVCMRMMLIMINNDFLCIMIIMSS